MKTNAVRQTSGVAFITCTSLVMMLLGCATSGSSFDIDRKTVDGLPSVTATGTAWAEVKVEAVDYLNRSIALAGSDGESAIFQVDASVKNFNQIKKGDVVHVEYADRLEVNVRKTDEPLKRSELISLNTAALGQKPGIVATRVVEKTTTVDEIDHATRVVKFRGADGRTFTLTASKKLKNLDKVMVGDRVVFTYCEAISINVRG